MEAKYSDGTRASWSYPASGEIVLDITGSDGDNIRFTESADQRNRTVKFAKRQILSEYDIASRLISLSDNGRILLRQEWSPDGRLQVKKSETNAEHFEYGADGLISSVILASPGESGTFKHWRKTKLDPAGRPVEITDYSGLQMLMNYSGTGELTAIVTRRDDKNYGFRIARDDSGRIQEISSSWGEQQYVYDSAGFLTKLEEKQNGSNMVAEWKSGLLQKVKQFDGGVFSFAYYEDGHLSGLPKQTTTPNRLVLNYQFNNTTKRLSEVTVGDVYRLVLDYDAKGRLTGWHNSHP